MKRIYGKKRHKAPAIIICCLIAVFILLAGLASLVFSEISGKIGKNGLLLAASSAESDAVEAMAIAVDEAGKEAWYWYENAETVSVSTDDGLNLAAVVYKADKKTNKWVIVVHGYCTNKEAMRPYAQKYFEAGYNVLMPDLRAHGESEGEFVGMGWLDRNDILCWVNSIIARDKSSEIVLHGLSMGASAVMMAAGEDLPGNVKAVVEDCGYTSVWDILAYQLKKEYNLPSFPVMHGASIWSKSKWGFDWKEASAVEQLKKSKTPVLFIHGGDDNLVPTRMAYELYEAADCEKRLLIIEGAAHASSMSTDPERYWQEIFGFINLYLKW